VRSQYETIYHFFLAHPSAVMARALRFLTTICGWILPRGLGFLGMLGLCLMVRRQNREARPLSARLWPALPAILLPLMAFAWPEERVVGTFIPFLMIVAAAGLGDGWDILLLHRARWRRAALILMIALAILPWSRAAVACLEQGYLMPPQTEKDIVARVNDGLRDQGGITSNSPVVSFYAG